MENGQETKENDPDQHFLLLKGGESEEHLKLNHR